MWWSGSAGRAPGAAAKPDRLSRKGPVHRQDADIASGPWTFTLRA